MLKGRANAHTCTGKGHGVTGSGDFSLYDVSVWYREWSNRKWAGRVRDDSDTKGGSEFNLYDPLKNV